MSTRAKIGAAAVGVVVLIFLFLVLRPEGQGVLLADLEVRP